MKRMCLSCLTDNCIDKSYTYRCTLSDSFLFVSMTSLHRCNWYQESKWQEKYAKSRDKNIGSESTHNKNTFK